MTDRPIIFSAPMVRALLDGRKTETRRLAWRQVVTYPDCPKSWLSGLHCGDGYTYLETIWQKASAGDRLWVREKHWCAEIVGGGIGAPYLIYDDEWRGGLPNPAEERIWLGPPYYDDDEDRDIKWGPRPSIHMPRWASRLTLVVTEARRERLQDITDNGVVAEGVEVPDWKLIDKFDVTRTAGTDLFRPLWNSLHGPGAWEANPEVMAIRFEVHRANIDSKERAA